MSTDEDSLIISSHLIDPSGHVLSGAVWAFIAYQAWFFDQNNQEFIHKKNLEIAERRALLERKAEETARKISENA
jgi:hypothetical protein